MKSKYLSARNCSGLISPGPRKSCFSGKVEQKLLSLNNFASHGNSWTVDSIENIELRFPRSKPIAASSYLALPTELASCQYLLNIRNRQNKKYFLYCYIAQCHHLFAPALIPLMLHGDKNRIQLCTVQKTQEQNNRLVNS